ncbi:MAG: hypothetical protein KJO85_01190, partial [Gammaproteobacteria bacterium]|nr:hypothetical protein [Gammaproteobacteria bacterium]
MTRKGFCAFFPVLCMAIGLGPVSAFGATFYVSTSGLDSNPGTAAQPWRTVQYAVDSVAPG